MNVFIALKGTHFGIFILFGLAQRPTSISKRSEVMNPVAEWLRPLILSALNRSSSHRCGFEPARVTCETNQVLLAGGQVFFLWNLPFSPNLTIDSAQNE